MSLYEKFRKMPFIEIAETGAFKKFYSESKYSKMSDEEKESTYAESLQDFMTHVRDLKITKDNIADFYEHMSGEDLEKYSYILDDIFSDRQEFIDKKGLTTTESTEHEIFEHYAHFSITGLSVWGVKDTLKPIDEYIAEIKESEAYKEYAKTKEPEKGTVARFDNKNFEYYGYNTHRDLYIFRECGTSNTGQLKTLASVHHAIEEYQSFKQQIVAMQNNKLLNIHQKIQNNEEIPSSEFSKIDFESKVFDSLDDDVKEAITEYVTARSDAINADALEKDKQQSTLTDLNV